MDETRKWVLKYNHWYNFIHKHSGIKFVTTHQRHAGLADKILAKKKEYIKVPRSETHTRLRGEIRNWVLPEVLHLNLKRNTTKVKSA
tara:strand:+ start:87 stop:347 length:261 start_codon:yes stop_codon:yes gene_type:complete